MADLITDALALLRTAKLGAAEAMAMLESAALGTGDANAAPLLADVRKRLASTQDMHLQLAHLLLRIERQQKLAREALHFEHPVYWRHAADGTKEGPYCPTCWEGKRRVSALKSLPFRGHDRWACPVCSRSHFSEGARLAMEAAERAAGQEASTRGGLHVGD